MLTPEETARRGVRLLARDADITAQRGVDYQVAVDPIIEITIWNATKLGPKPTQAEWEARADDQTVVLLKSRLQQYSWKQITKEAGSLVQLGMDALRLSQLSDERQTSPLGEIKQNQLDALHVKATRIQDMKKAQNNVRSTIVITDTIEDVMSRYDVEISGL